MQMKWLSGFALAAALSVSGGVQASVEIHEPWVREAPPNATALAAYMVMENRGANAEILTDAFSLEFEDIELHATVHEGDMARMVQQEQIEIPPMERVVFERGGLHLMLMRPKQPLREGDEVSITLRFASGMQIPMMFPVRKADAPAMGHGNHHHHH
jgi:periplasmic copper chaperone A